MAEGVTVHPALARVLEQAAADTDLDSATLVVALLTDVLNELRRLNTNTEQALALASRRVPLFRLGG